MPFTKGDPNINRKGRPKGISITEMVRQALEEVEEKTGKTWKDLIIKRILLKATSDGDVQMLKTIWQYIDGMPQQSTDITTGGDKIQGNVFYYPAKRSLETPPEAGESTSKS